MANIIIDIEKISDIIRDVAEDKIVPRFQQLAQSEIRSKSSPTDLVTIADEEAEIELTRILKGLYPNSHVLGEEAVSSGIATRDILSQTEDPVWIVDPVDGTSNFAHGTPVFGTMVALVQGGERVASWIYQIPKRRMVACEKGAGVRMDRMAFAPPEEIKGDADFKTMRAFVSRKFIPPHMRPYVDEQVKQMGDVSTFMCCAWEYVEVLEGKSAFSLYKRIEPWDHMAGVLMLEEAGYYIRKWDGTPYAAHDLQGGLINAPNEELWRRVYDLLLKKDVERISEELY
jgi:fructose-1,6-bisphosphatase/inositol monophosphatase family enzyme